MAGLKLGGLWPFRKQDKASQATHKVQVEVAWEGVYYAADPALADWPEHWEAFGDDSGLVALLAQALEMGMVEQQDERLWLSWEALYRILENEDEAGGAILAQLKLPELTDIRPSLVSHGSLEDPDFRVTLGDWSHPSDTRLSSPPDITGAVVQADGGSWLLREPVWRMVQAVRMLYTQPEENRTASGNRKAWATIRRHAIVAGAPMEDFLQRTVILTPDKLNLEMRQVNVQGTRTVEITPAFEDAPSRWLEIFDRFPNVPERYDIPDGARIVQVMITPQVRSVLREIRRWPARMVSGQRAESFIRNPYASLGDDAVAVIDEEQFEHAREAAGITFERFSIVVDRDDSDVLTGVALLIESASSHDIYANRYDFPDAARLERFIYLLQSRLQGGYQCVVWEGYELELLGDAEDRLKELWAALEEWRSSTVVIRYADVFDLSRYSDRVEGFGVEQQYLSPFIARKSDEQGWIPDNVVFGVLLTPDGVSEPIRVTLSPQDRRVLEESIKRAEQNAHDHVFIPGTDQPVSLDEARQVLEILRITEQTVNRGEFSPQGRPPKQSLLLKANIDQVDYRENRQQALELPRDREARLPRSLRADVTLKPHQTLGVAWLQHLWANVPDHCRGALLADDMGLGKTLQILTFIAHCLEDNPALEPVLVVAPVSLLENWKEEIEKFFSPNALPILTLYGHELSNKKLAQNEIDPQLLHEGIVRFLEPDWLGDAKLVLTTYETLRDLEFSLAAQHWSIMVCDEAQKIKNPNALVTRAAKKQNVRFKIACTGTPVENSLADLWCLFDFIQPGLLGALNDFGARYRRPIEAKTDEERMRVDELRALIEPQILRRTKTQVAKDLPKKIEVTNCRNLAMSAYQRQLYGQAIQGYRAKTADGSIKNHLGLIQYLRQVCSAPYPHGQGINPNAVLSDQQTRSPKLRWLLDILSTIEQRGEKAIVFVELLDLQRQLQRYIREHLGYTADIINGSTSAAATAANSRQKRIKAFQQKPGFGVIILSPLAVGFGVNIQAANHVIHYTRTWNPAKEDQATDRAYRIGQIKDVYVYYPVITAEFTTFDMKLDSLLAWKRSLSEDMLNGCGDLSSSDFSTLVTPEGEEIFEDLYLEPADLLAIDGVMFEGLIAALMTKQGYSVVYRTLSGPRNGIHVVAIRDTEGMLVHCHTGSSRHSHVTEEAINELIADKPIYETKHPKVRFREVAATNLRSSQEAAAVATRQNVMLWDYEGLAEMLVETPLLRWEVEEMLSPTS